jgi:hypothetical protein
MYVSVGLSAEHCVVTLSAVNVSYLRLMAPVAYRVISTQWTSRDKFAPTPHCPGHTSKGDASHLYISSGASTGNWSQHSPSEQFDPQLMVCESGLKIRRVEFVWLI